MEVGVFNAYVVIMGDIDSSNLFDSVRLSFSSSSRLKFPFSKSLLISRVV